eukprot:gb/GEZJ01000443.1/.p1 GENE.gb/GEZJ01000443.1/~~gb/GEZJ01000443.1/.p1  ORF type:complete len:539 (-),score=105.75 gb/GEZJ01000443.1/:149-1765(-)
MNGARVARSSHEEALSLVRRIPTVKSAWVYARPVGNLRWRAAKRCWAELRGNTLLLHVVGEQSSRANPEHLARRTASENVMMINLKDSRIRSDTKKNRIRIKRSSGENSIELKLKDTAETKKWHSALVRAATHRATSLNDFEILSQVGKGASGRVFLVRDRLTAEHLALKVIEKSFVYENDDAYRHALDERLVLEMACDHPFILNLRYAFQTSKRLYLVTEFCDGGDLFDYLKRRGKPFKEPEGRRIAAEILLALEYIHSLGVVYRDLKLENVLLDLDGHIRIADFGLSKLLGKRRHHSRRPPPIPSPNLRIAPPKPVNMTKTFCGTREYIAPEMLNGSEYGQSVDLWAFGILLYEILCGRTPFYSRNREEVYTKIENGPLRFPRNLSAEVISLIRGLLDRNPNTRLGLGPQGISEIKQHDFFHDMDWEALFQKEDHPDNIVVERNPIGIVEEHSSSSKSDPEKLKSSKNPVNEIDMAGKEADMLLEDESQEEKKRPDVFALFVSTKKKAANIAGYSYAAVPQPPPNAAVHESSQLLR